MSDNTSKMSNAKKYGIIGATAIAVVIIIVIVKNKLTASSTVILPPRTQTPGSPVVPAGSVIATVQTTITTLFGPSPLATVKLPSGLKKNSAGNGIVTSSGVSVKTYDPNTGAYQESDGTWYLQDGTALLAYDMTNGVYQEEDQTWYTFDGTALATYNITTGVYSEENDPTTYYDRNGNPVSS